MSDYKGGNTNSGVDWDYYDNRFDAINDKYLPDSGEGETMATQICTAVNKLIYKWYNDGDVYDNTNGVAGWCNDLSSYANWLAMYASGAREILERIYDCYTHNDYEHILKDLADTLLTDANMKRYNAFEKRGSVYKCKNYMAESGRVGKFVCRERDEDYYCEQDDEEDDNYEEED